VRKLLAAAGKRQRTVCRGTTGSAICLQHIFFHSTGGKQVSSTSKSSSALVLQCARSPRKRDCLERDVLGCGGSRHRSNRQRWLNISVVRLSQRHQLISLW